MQPVHEAAQVRDTVPSIGVVVVNWNARDALSKCLDSLHVQTTPPRRTVVIDNASTDGSVEQVHRNYPAVDVIVLERNFGYCVAANLGVGQLRTDLVVLLNNDAVCDPRFLESMTAAALARPSVAMFTPRMLRLRDPLRIDNCGIGLSFWLAGYQIGAGHLFGRRFEKSSEVFGASGAALVARRTLFEKIGPFDETLDYNQDDFDFSFRAQLAGERCWYVADAVVHHYGSLSANRVAEQTLKRILRNQETVLIKVLPWELAFLLPLHAAYVVFQLGKWAFRGYLPLAIRAKLEAIEDIGVTLRKRREVQATRVGSAWKILRFVRWPDKNRSHLAQ